MLGNTCTRRLTQLTLTPAQEHLHVGKGRKLHYTPPSFPFHPPLPLFPSAENEHNGVETDFFPHHMHAHAHTAVALGNVAACAQFQSQQQTLTVFRHSTPYPLQVRCLFPTQQKMTWPHLLISWRYWSRALDLRELQLPHPLRITQAAISISNTFFFFSVFFPWNIYSTRLQSLFSIVINLVFILSYFQHN